MTMAPPALRAVSRSTAKVDARLTAPEAQEVARAALTGIAAPAEVGEYVGAIMEGDRLASLAFTCLSKGYLGWCWVVTLARAPRSRTVTVCETELLPSDAALLSPEWIAWSDRLRPGDIGPGDVLPFQADDVRLEQGYEATGDEDADQLAIYELGLGRPRVLSREGRTMAADRWYAGESGPSAPIAQRAKAHCITCGFMMPMAGSLRQAFGVCANEWSASDGRVVALEHGCGAHSETDLKARPSDWPDTKSGIGKEYGIAASEVELVETGPAAAPAPTISDAAPDDVVPEDANSQDAAPDTAAAQEPAAAD